MAYSKEQIKEQQDYILESLMQGRGIETIAKEDKTISRAQMYRLLAKDKEFRSAYIDARALQSDFCAEKIRGIIRDLPEDPTKIQIAKAHLEIEAEKWIASKLLPKKYGSATAIQQNNTQVNVEKITGAVIFDSTKDPEFAAYIKEKNKRG